MDIDKFLRHYNYSPPNIVEDTINQLKVYMGDDGAYYLTVNDEPWFKYNPKRLTTVSQVFSHYKLAQGHTICTGMGFLAREKWILTKPSVTKLTVIERSVDIINYHLKHNKDICDKIEIINTDANEYKGSCDTLLLDHYEYEGWKTILRSVETCSNNIQANTIWWWTLESMLMREKVTYEELKKQFTNLPNLNTLELSIFKKVYNGV